jgi:signal transduction histidine kinase
MKDNPNPFFKMTQNFETSSSFIHKLNEAEPREFEDTMSDIFVKQTNLGGMITLLKRKGILSGISLKRTLKYLTERKITIFEKDMKVFNGLNKKYTKKDIDENRKKFSNSEVELLDNLSLILFGNTGLFELFLIDINFANNWVVEKMVSLFAIELAEADFDKYTDFLTRIVQNLTTQEAYHIKGRLFQKEEKYKEAINEYSEAILSGDSTSAQFYRGECYELIGDLENAAYDFIGYYYTDNRDKEFFTDGYDEYFGVMQSIYDNDEFGLFIEIAEQTDRSIIESFFTDEDIETNEKYQNKIDQIHAENNLMTEKQREKYTKDRDIAIRKARLNERNKIMANLSHTVKNMLSSVIDPLERIKETGEAKPVVVDNAIRGANLIRSLVNAMNLSFKGSLDDFVYDVQYNTYENSSSIEEMFTESLKQSISTTFDGKYFKKFVDNYYPTKANFLEAKQKWNDMSQFNDLEKIISFMNKFLLKTTLDISHAKEYVIGNDKGSALKLFILIQEIILNAVKYSSFVLKDSRNLHISFGGDDKKISIKVFNTFKPNVQVKSCGLGLEIINNFSKLLQTKPIIKRENDVYSVEIKCKNIWRNTQ